MKKSRSVIVLSTLLASCSYADVVYSNMEFFSGNLFYLSRNEPQFRWVGDEAILTGQNRIVDRISFYWAAFAPVTFDVELAFFKNDGAPTGGSPRPKTMLWRTLIEDVTISKTGELFRFNFDVPKVVVPDNFTFATKLKFQPNEGPSYASFHPPTVGQSGTYVWGGTEDASNWVRYSSGPRSLAMELSAVAEYALGVLPTSFSMIRGSVVSGNLASLGDSDDDRLVMRPGTVFSSGEPPVQVVVNSVAPQAVPTAFSFQIEGNASFANAEQVVSLFNFVSGQYEVLDTRLAVTTDNVVRVEPSGDLSRFVQPATLAIRAKVSFRALGPAFSYPWEARLDQARWAFED